MNLQKQIFQIKIKLLKKILVNENINRYLNSNLKRGKCSKTLLREAILNIMLKFYNKYINNTKINDILKYYI